MQGHLKDEYHERQDIQPCRWPSSPHYPHGFNARASGSGPMTSTRETGARIEALARGHLEAAGLHFVAANYSTPRGEIDLIMRDGKQLIFVEVRYRRDNRFGGGAASVDRRKQARLILAAQHYLQTLRRTPACRFDIVAVSGRHEPPLDGLHVTWLQDAFQVPA